MTTLRETYHRALRQKIAGLLDTNGAYWIDPDELTEEFMDLLYGVTPSEHLVALNRLVSAEVAEPEPEVDVLDYPAGYEPTFGRIRQAAAEEDQVDIPPTREQDDPRELLREVIRLLDKALEQGL